MRKAHIINLEKMGGVERLFLQYIHDNTAKNDVIFCISNKIGPEIAQHLTNRNVVFVNRMLNAFTLKYPVFARKYALQTKLWLADPEAVIVWDLIPGFAGKPARGKVIYYDHGCSWRYAHNAKTLGFFAMLDGCISAAKASKRVMELRFNLTCPVQTVINRILPPPNIERGPKPLTSPLKLGIAARLVGLKGISVALLAVKALRDRDVDVTLDIAGKGPDEAAFRALAEKLNITDCVNFLGFQDDLSQFFNHIHIYLSTPVTEPFGLSCMEALFYGVPVIFPNIDGQPEVVKDGVCGIGITPTITPAAHQEQTGVNVDFPHQVYSPYSDTLVEPLLMSPEAIADAVQQIAGSAYADYRDNAFKYVEEHFDYKNFICEFNARISDIVDANVKK
ncbi:glycosyltransferase family 4 protein [Yokenella regensburgei]|jgi:glycosyltransferase involved in cell wall biosynthesis|uniref:glycosyltransferase family 4 protein n=1 Tax=Yokenella regensburgei TaxID=158877 RepID=UPI000242264C|nr:glycosyltransferase family 4 protein [Yokenella regensburgei]EHM50065.1 glycosyltransferase, group 1 family protein [Yokenella regensburgei ATCC 43003]